MIGLLKLKGRATLCRLLFTSALCLLPVVTLSAQSFPDTYDEQIERSVKRWMPLYESVYGFEILKAQLYQESLLKPDAVSHVGASGLGQFMPGTWEDVSKKLGYDGISVFSVDHNIEASAFYMSSRLNVWHAPRPMSDRLSLSWACYNAGCLWVLKAQALCENKNLYSEIIKCLPAITGDNSKETITYVKKIWHWWMRMKFQ